MNAMEHYREAERRIGEAEGYDAETAAVELQYAAVHAALALAAVQAMAGDWRMDHSSEWREEWSDTFNRPSRSGGPRGGETA